MFEVYAFASEHVDFEERLCTNLAQGLNLSGRDIALTSLHPETNVWSVAYAINDALANAESPRQSKWWETIIGLKKQPSIEDLIREILLHNRDLVFVLLCILDRVFITNLTAPYIKAEETE